MNDSTPLYLCKSCGVSKPLTSAYFAPEKARRNGFRTECKDCRNLKRRTRYALKGISSPWKSTLYKRCSRCDEVKKREEFNNFAQGIDGKCPHCRECNKGLQATYNHENRDEINRRARAKYDRKLRRAQWLKSREGQRQNSQARSRRHYHANKLLYIGYSNRRRAWILQAAGAFTRNDVLAKFELQGGLCYYCFADLTEIGYEVEHKIPLGKGGSNWPANICCACFSCNRSKNAKGFWEFLDEVATRQLTAA